MFDKTMFGFLLDSDKSICSLGDFIHKFYVKADYYRLKYEENSFDELLTCIYNLDDKEYKKWMKEYRRMTYSFVKERLYLITTIARNENFENLITAHDMYKKALSLAARALPVKANYTDVTENKERLLKELRTVIMAIRNNKPNNPVERSQEEFKKFFEDVQDNDLLKDYYLELYYNLDTIILDKIKDEMKNVEAQAQKFSTTNVSYHTNKPMYNKKFN